MRKVSSEHLAFVVDLARQRHGHITASDVVAAARPKSSALHSYFEWNDSAAARAYREVQARDLIRQVTLVVKRADLGTLPSPRAFVATRIAGSESGQAYQYVPVLLRQPDGAMEYMLTVVRELRSYLVKYQTQRMVCAAPGFDDMDARVAALLATVNEVVAEGRGCAVEAA